MATNGQIGFAVTVIAILAMSYRDMTNSITSEPDKKDIPVSKLSSFNTPTLKFAFWFVYILLLLLILFKHQNKRI